MENNAAGLLGFLMLMQLIFLLALLAGGLYALFALGRAAAGLDRLASAMETWVERQNNTSPSVRSIPPNIMNSPLPPVSGTPSTASAGNEASPISWPKYLKNARSF